MTDDRPTFGSLFAGIGGIDLGLERAGWRGRWQVEYESFCQRVLARHWPDVTRYGDIHDVDWSTVERVDLVAGGFPCQPVSGAGQKRAQDDARWLWPEFLRCVRALRPRLVLVENVAGLLDRGMGDVLGGLAESGYDTEWDCIPAAALGAPHLRDRVWIVAHTTGERRDGGTGTEGDPGDAAGQPTGHQQQRRGGLYRSGSLGEPVPDPDGRRRRQRDEGERRVPVVDAGGHVPDAWRRGSPGSRQPLDAVHPTAFGDWQATQPLDGRLADQWRVEPDVGRVAHGVPARVDRLRALGNAVVPQVVEFIGHRIIESMTPDRTPHRGDPILLYSDRRTVLDLIDRGSGLLVVAEDDAGLRIERYADRLTWDDDARAWRAVG